MKKGTKARKGPLRKVVGYVKHEIKLPNRTIETTREVLECGHVQPVVRDVYGETNADRRRCKKC